MSAIDRKRSRSTFGPDPPARLNAHYFRLRTRKTSKIGNEKKSLPFAFFPLQQKKRGGWGKNFDGDGFHFRLFAFTSFLLLLSFFCWQVCKRGRCCFPESESSGSGKKWGLFRNLLRFFFLPLVFWPRSELWALSAFSSGLSLIAQMSPFGIKGISTPEQYQGFLN